jgi:hypothetical protein
MTLEALKRDTLEALKRGHTRKEMRKTQRERFSRDALEALRDKLEALKRH